MILLCENGGVGILKDMTLFTRYALRAVGTVLWALRKDRDLKDI